MTPSVVAAYQSIAHEQGDATHEDLLREYPLSAQPDDENPIVAALEQCLFYGDFDADPFERNQEFEAAWEKAKEAFGENYMKKIRHSRQHHPLKRVRRYNFRLEEDEEARLKRLGFVVVEAMQAESFADMCYHLSSDDMPVYITSDSVLHAWHRSFDAFLADLEETALCRRLCCILRHASPELEHMIDTCETVALSSLLVDADYFVAVALNLLSACEYEHEVNAKRVSGTVVDIIAQKKLSCGSLVTAYSLAASISPRSSPVATTPDQRLSSATFVASCD